MQAGPTSEGRRLEVLRRYRVLDSPPEQAFDNITRLAAEVCSTPMALVSLVDEARQWFKSRVGIDVAETPRESAFCAHAIAGSEPMVVSDAMSDPRFADNVLVTGDPKIRFYAGVPLISPEGCALGTLCVLDRVPRALSLEDLGLLRGLARQVESELELRRGLAEMRDLVDGPPSSSRARAGQGNVAVSQQALIDELERVQREKDMLVQFLVHDLKSPLMTVLLNSTLLQRAPWADARTREIACDVETSATAMQRLVMDLLDIGKSNHGRLVCASVPLELPSFLEEAATGMRSRARLKDQQLIVEPFEGKLEFSADRQLLRRVLENLIENSLKYSEVRSRVTLGAERAPRAVRFFVRDEGPGIPDAERERIFEPFARVPGGAAYGHGLGLTFCKLAVEAHGGSIWAEPNTPKGSRFILQLPLGS